MALGFSEVRSRLLGGGFLGWKREAEDEGPPRRAKPVGISIRWNPVPLSGRELAEDHARAHELFVTQAALRQARGHLSGSGEEFGFLLGRRYRCRESDAPWIHITDALPASTPFPAGGETERFRLACVSAKTQAAARGLEVVGWYHEHRYLGPTFTDGDRQLHEDSFPEPWHCALVFVTGGARTAGACIQAWRGERYYQRALVSFQEVLDDVADLDAEVRSCIDWSNYVPERPVSLLPPEKRVSAPPVPETTPRRGREAAPGTGTAEPPPRPAESPRSEDRPPAPAARRPETSAEPPWLRQFEAARHADVRRHADAAGRADPPRSPDAAGRADQAGPADASPGAAAREEPGSVPRPTAETGGAETPAAAERARPAPETPRTERTAADGRARRAHPEADPGPEEPPPADFPAAKGTDAVEAEKPARAPRRLPIDDEFGLILPMDEEPRRRGGWRAVLRRILPGR